LQPCRAGSDNLARDRVSVDDDGAEVGQPTCDLALAGADATGEPYDEQ
jgi:hypothetical protein